MEVSEYLKEFEGISDELRVLAVVEQMPFQEARRHYSRRLVEVQRYVADLSDLLACEEDDLNTRSLHQQLIAIAAIVPK
jgi:hypothetical protein